MTAAAGGPGPGVRSARIVGTGLIGTSIGLAATAAGVAVVLEDRDPQRLRRAVARGAGSPASEPAGPVDLVVVAVPPAEVARTVVAELRQELSRTVTHVASVQAHPLHEVEAEYPDATRFVGGHPIAGREISGPDGASAELFRDRAWVVCPGPGSGPEAVADVEALAAICRARPVRMDAEAHDRLLAQLSHVPQLVASALAGAVAELPAPDVALAGSGLRDTTRLADSDPGLWADIISANPEAVAAGVRAVVGPLLALADGLESGALDIRAAVSGLLERGRTGRSKLPGKHGQTPTAWATVSVVVPDRPGALAELLAAVARHGVNLEDLRVEHAPGQPEGAAELAVAPAARDHLATSLRADGWAVTLGADAAR